jgi:hypothetical protein
MTSRTMKSMAKLAAAGAVLLVALPGAAAADRSAAGVHPTQVFEATLRPVAHDPAADGGTEASGRAKLTIREGNVLTTKLRASGLSPQVHVMHIHGAEQAAHECPGPDRRDDLVNDGLIETVEGLEDYGPVVVALTTTGDTSPASTLAVDRYEVAGEDGRIEYNRTFAIPQAIADTLENQHIVVHGHDINGDGSYASRVTALGAPLEAELPVACGEIDRR